jgi:hypothetical protein
LGFQAGPGRHGPDCATTDGAADPRARWRTGTAERPEFFEQVLGDEADAAARKAAKKPWWLPANRAGYYFKIGGLYFTLAVAALIASFAGAPVAYARMFACLW